MASGDRPRFRDVLVDLGRASDLGMGLPEDRSVRCALTAYGIATAAGVSAKVARDAVYVALLRFAGCTADSHLSADAMGNEIEVRGQMYGKAHFGEPREMLAFVWALSGRDRGIGGQVAAFARTISKMPALYRTAVAHCEVNGIVVDRLGLDEDVRRALGDVFECWNGTGLPRKLRGERIAHAARIATVADDLEAAHHLGGLDAALARSRFASGRALDPSLCRAFAEHGDEICAPLGAPSPSTALAKITLADEPVLDDDAVDRLCSVLADIADLKGRFTLGHSSAVAELAIQAAAMVSVPASERTSLRRAALVHDLGRIGVSASIWDHPGPLTDAQWESVRMHSLMTERVLARSRVLAPLVDLAGVAHERSSGTGYHRRLPASAISRAARVMAAADVLQALRSERPHRAALDLERTKSVLGDEVRAGHLDGDAVEAVLAASGETPRAHRRSVANLTEREVEVLGLLARGLTNRAIADKLGVAPKTAGNHVQAVLGKLGVSTRAAAAMFAMRHGILS